MQNPPSLFLVLLVVMGVVSLVAVVAGARLRPTAPSRGKTFAALLPALAIFGLFYSLAVHMHQALGGWPTSIGERGFSPFLVTHARVAVGSFGMLLLVSILGWPVALLLCAFVQRWRGGVFYLGIYGLSFLACLGFMLLAPSEFLYWWRD